jgi:hypothetical protein
MPTFYALDLV